ncbi:MAG TPA: hypothetical protein VLA62_01680, partial [Solirubrobacterales bacterium]|nr:hypothetical protein [Solirubrobacterales bacterium]
LLADACASADSPAEGLAAVADARAIAARTGERFYEAELHRLEGELLWRARPRDRGAPDECLLKANELARRQGARWLELRAVMSLSRVWREQGRAADARPMLAEAWGGFTEGFDTVDLREAQALLGRDPGHALKAPRPSPSRR